MTILLAASAQAQVKGICSATDGAEMQVIPSGEFEMGWSEAEARAAWQEDVERWRSGPRQAGWPQPRLEDYLVSTPRHRVKLSAFLLDTHEVTNAMFNRYVEETGARPQEYREHPVLGRPGHPVVGVSWRDAYGYAAWAGKRLPTEAEWEYAARGPEGRAYPWGATWESDRANVPQLLMPNNRFKQTAPPGSFPRGVSPFGIQDLCGNAMEWVVDAYQPDYYASSPASDPPGPATGEFRILRGGGWRYFESPGIYRAAYRKPRYLGDRAAFVGFRCARSLPLD